MSSGCGHVHYVCIICAYDDGKTSSRWAGPGINKTIKCVHDWHTTSLHFPQRMGGLHHGRLDTGVMVRMDMLFYLYVV